MTQIIIKIEKGDIKTNRVGENFMLDCNNFAIIFDPEAFRLLMEDFASFEKGETLQLKEPPKLITESKK